MNFKMVTFMVLCVRERKEKVREGERENIQKDWQQADLSGHLLCGASWRKCWRPSEEAL
jgi:hypothetical protein